MMSLLKSLTSVAFVATSINAWSASITHNLNVEIIQVRDDAGSNGTPLTGSDGGSFIYATEVNDIWNQAGIQVTFSTSTWDNTAAQQLTSTERGQIYANTFAAGSGSTLPAIGVDTLQIFFVLDHPGTGYTGAAGTGWVANPLANPLLSARNAGNNQLYISGTFSSLGRGVMANEGFTTSQLGGTIAHEIGHALGLRHSQDVNGGAGAGTTQDPSYVIPGTENNLMWGAGFGPAFNGGLDDDPTLTNLQENFFLRGDQVDAAIFNGLDLDPDGNGTGVLQVIPEPGSAILLLAGLLPVFMCRRR